MKLSEFDFEFPTELLGTHPRENRDDSRLLVVHKETGKIEHKSFKNITDYFSEDDVMIFNDTKVFPARLMGNKEKTGDDIEVFLLRELNREDYLWDVLVDPARKIRVGNKLYFGEGELVAEVIDNTTSRGRTVKFLFNGAYEDFISRIDALGETPLPKALSRSVIDVDKERFQTVYAKELGAVSAPIAGLHFTEQYLKRLEILGVNIAKITLHIGLGTFRNVEVEDLTKHKTDSEYFSIKESQAQIINEGIKKKKKICAIGTTTLKTIESSVSANNLLKEKTGWTDKFIFPPYDFKIGNCMLTNFHLPKSTLYMMTCALAGFDLTQKVYKAAIKEKYKFFTYGDALLII